MFKDVSSWVHLILSCSFSRKFKTLLHLVLLAPRHHHSTPLLEKLHWLLISECIKVACKCYQWFWSCLPFWTATCLHSVSYTTLFFWHLHAKKPAIQTQDLCPFTLSLALDPTFGIHTHRALDTAQPCHLLFLKPNWKPSSSHSIFAPTII